MFYRIIGRHWEDIKAAFGDDYPHRFGFDSTGEFWQNILAVAYDYPTGRRHELVFVKPGRVGLSDVARAARRSPIRGVMRESAGGSRRAGLR
ncbi:MAG: hypothetical protein ACM30G_17460 [Micromonosporaceae bacterium]